MLGQYDTMQFQSTPPARGATMLRRGMQGADVKFQSTPPARGATAAISGRLR